MTCEWGQRRNIFNLCLYALKFDMVRLDTCIDGMGGFPDSNITRTYNSIGHFCHAFPGYMEHC